jgi:hypothetical protein
MNQQNSVVVYTDSNKSNVEGIFFGPNAQARANAFGATLGVAFDTVPSFVGSYNEIPSLPHPITTATA